MKQYLAIDIGASSGRHIVGRAEGGKIVTQEVYRFPNGARQEDGHLVWDTAALLSSVKAGIAAAFAACGKIDSIAIDTWGVDYVLMRGEEEVLPCYAYRDGRTEQAIAAVHEIVPFEKLYERTGIQFQPFNTVYQLYADKCAGRLEGVTDFLMIPAWLTYKLTGVKAHEYTNATTTGLVNAETRAFDKEICAALGLPEHLFGETVQPGAAAGRLLPEVAAEVGGEAEVVFCASHDTASAVLAAPVEEGEPYISSGTWSLLGIEQNAAHTDAESRANNFSNEGAPGGRFRYQKNIMGLWMLQSARKELGMGFAEAEEAARACPCKVLVDCNDEIFLAPASMCAAVRERAGAELSKAEVLACIYRSLADCYRRALAEMGGKAGARFSALHIIGGGSKDGFLNELTARAAGVSVIAGPTEATAIGNLLAQFLAGGEIGGIYEGRELVKRSFPLQTFEA